MKDTIDIFSGEKTKQIICPNCGKTLIRLAPFENNIYEFWCDECNIDVTIVDNNEKENEQ